MVIPTLPPMATGATFCSGIGAPEIAAPWIDWRLACDIEPFPRDVLRARFGFKLPDDPARNQGDRVLLSDMADITADTWRAHGLPLPDLIVAGTPCQAFSVAGARRGLEDPRGNLTLKFVEILHAIQDASPARPFLAIWENVPGVLSSRDNAFGCFLGAVVGGDAELPRPVDARGRPVSWPRVGMVSGPRARAAWAVRDAQFFGVPQRRRRVFVVVDFGGRADPAAVLFERESLRRDSAPG